MNRKEALNEAIKCVCETRDQQYGSPQENFTRIANLWNAYKPLGVTPHDVAVMMALLKVARIGSGQTKDDNYVDCAGYISIACELAAGTEASMWPEELQHLTPEERSEYIKEACAEWLRQMEETGCMKPEKKRRKRKEREKERHSVMPHRGGVRRCTGFDSPSPMDVLKETLPKRKEPEEIGRIGFGVPEH